jgi:hypothetical protein
MASLRKTLLVKKYSTEPYYFFDTYKFVSKLESEGFSKGQAESVLHCISSVLEGNVKLSKEEIVDVKQQALRISNHKIDFNELKSEIQHVERTEFAKLKAENESVK